MHRNKRMVLGRLGQVLDCVKDMQLFLKVSVLYYLFKTLQVYVNDNRLGNMPRDFDQNPDKILTFIMFMHALLPVFRACGVWLVLSLSFALLCLNVC